MSSDLATQHELLSSPQELVIGLVGAVGVEMAHITECIEQAFTKVRYSSEIIRLSEALADIPGAPWNQPLPTTEDEKLATLMDRGNEFRRRLGRSDAMALLTASLIQDRRVESTGREEKPRPSHVYIVRALKRPEEVSTLRRIYGRGFILIGVYLRKDKRISNLANRFRSNLVAGKIDHLESQANLLIERDAAERENPYGQNVRGAFWQSDVFVDANDPGAVAKNIDRFIELLFGNEFHTPNRDEHGMFLASATSMRSASLGRQVGAVIATGDGSVISVGTNEVPKYGGGIYWDNDSGDARDHTQGHDPSDTMRRDLVVDVIDRLKKHGWLSDEKTQKTEGELLNELINGDVMKGADFNSIIEFQRPVHAEMTALTDAARRGVPVQGATLYTTTFPCHGCARHIVASGLEKVVYVEPYPKSLSHDLHRDSIALDDDPGENKVKFVPFVGIAPRMYMDLFRMIGDRKTSDGRVAKWMPSSARLKLELGLHVSCWLREKEAVDQLKPLMEETNE